MSAGAAFYLLLATVLGAALVCVRPLGAHIANVMEGRAHLFDRRGDRVERLLQRICGGSVTDEMCWSGYAIALLVFNTLGAVVVYGLQRLQGSLPLNPEHLGAVAPDAALNTAISFITNTDWQDYGGESTLGYLVQMAGLTVQNFLSAATGMAVAIALTRGCVRRCAKTIGNFWVDVSRATFYVLLPIAAVLAVALVASGVIQNLDRYQPATMLERLTYAEPQVDVTGAPLHDAAGHARTKPLTTTTQILPMGPVASQEAIKELGTNGGGFFNANSAHPFENPSAVSNLLQMIAILLIPFALTHTFGRMVGDARQGWALLAAMLVLFVPLVISGYVAEQHGNPLLAAHAVDQAPSLQQAGGNMEGKETRFGIAASALFVAVTTATSCGAVNTMHDSLMPIGGLVPLALMQLGELAPGGAGTGLYTILMFAILGVFVAGLMIGRTPEYLGKKIEAAEMKLVSIFILATPLVVLIGTAVAVALPAGRAGVANPGPHGFSEILYAFSSAANNNGSAFNGLSVNTVFYNLATGAAMWFGRFVPLVAALALAGSLAAKKRVPVTEGTMPTHGPLFVSLLIGSIVLIGVLTYVPALALGPIVEQLMLPTAP